MNSLDEWNYDDKKKKQLKYAQYFTIEIVVFTKKEEIQHVCFKKFRKFTFDNLQKNSNANI